MDTLREARRSLVEARQIADAARHDRREPAGASGCRTSGWPGCCTCCATSRACRRSWSANWAPLLEYDARHPREQLLGTLRAYLEPGRNKSAAAAAAHLSRPAFYERLARIARILGVDLDSVEHLPVAARGAAGAGRGPGHLSRRPG